MAHPEALIQHVLNIAVVTSNGYPVRTYFLRLLHKALSWELRPHLSFSGASRLCRLQRGSWVIRTFQIVTYGFTTAAVHWSEREYK